MKTPDDSLAKTLADTLDRAERQLDPTVIRQLAQRRQQALAGAAVANTFPRYRRFDTRQWGALAAMVSLCALMLGVSHSLLPGQASVANRLAGQPPLAPDYWTEEPDMLADWEMLDAIGEDPDAT